MTDYPSFDVEQVKALFYQWEEHKGEGIMTFRNHGYKSVMTGATAPLLLGPEGQPIDWKDAMADTCESFNMPDLFEGNERKSQLQPAEKRPLSLPVSRGETATTY